MNTQGTSPVRYARSRNHRKKIRSPLFALWQHYIRTATVIDYIGLTSFALVIFLCFLFSFVQLTYDNERWFLYPLAVSGFGIVLYWGTIFGSHRKNRVYRFLKRRGIHEDIVWQSRLAIPFLCYIPVLLAVLFCMGVNGMRHIEAGSVELLVYIFMGLQNAVCFWLAPAALGSFFSIYFRGQVMSVIATFFGYLCVLYWIVTCNMHYFFIPVMPHHWITIIPVCLVLLHTSRLRAKYWLRDTV